ncbi:cell division protein FtsQ/DivIB [Pseudomonas sp. Marseille-QA0892]
MFQSIRHSQPIGRPAARKAPQRGASRPVVKPPLSQRLPKPSLSLFKRFSWPFLLAALGFGSYELAQRVMPYADRPIAQVAVEGDMSYISRQAIEQRIGPYVTANFFSVDLAGMRQELEGMPWIAHAEVRRVWPDQVVIRLEEQMPIARWGDQALLNNQGQAFEPRDLSHYEQLPLLNGPQRAQQRVMQQYQVLSQLLRPLGFTIAGLELRERGSWFLTTAANDRGPGFELFLGRDRIVEKVRRFIAIYDHALKEQIANVKSVDLRYANGLAVAWREPVPEATDKSVAMK